MTLFFRVCNPKAICRGFAIPFIFKKMDYKSIKHSIRDTAPDLDEIAKEVEAVRNER